MAIRRARGGLTSKGRSTPPMLWRMCECPSCGRMAALRRGLKCRECVEAGA